MAIQVKLDVFEGPLDLLLHLIEKNELDIYDIPIALITDQYIEYIQSMKQINMEIASEFLIMAATLISIKSKLLLPVKDEEEEEDPRDELVQKLLAYRKYKYVSFLLKEKMQDSGQVIYKEPEFETAQFQTQKKIKLSDIECDATIEDLFTAFSKVLKASRDRIDPIRSKFNKVTQDRYTVAEKVEDLFILFKKEKKISFTNLFLQIRMKEEAIVTFLALLELIKIGKVKADQEKQFDEIEVYWIDGSESHGD